MRNIALIVAIPLIGACGSDLIREENVEPFAIVGAPVYEGCQNPSVNIVGIVSIDSGSAIPIHSVTGPISVSPGPHEIFLVCPNPLDESGDACVSLGFDDEKPTFKVQLEAGERYAFTCYLEDGEPLYTLSDYGYSR